MLISPKTLKLFWRLTPRTIVHVGAHEAEELGPYVSAGWGSEGVLWVEAIPDKLPIIRKKIYSSGLKNHTVAEAVVWSEPGKALDFFRTNNGESSSVYELKQHLVEYPDIHVVTSQQMTSVTLANLIPNELFPIGLLNIDIQGAELQALKGLGSKLQMVKAIYCEVNFRELYKDAPLLPELDAWLHQQGFSLVDIVKLSEGWGDGLWLNNAFYNPKLRRTRRYLRLFYSALIPTLKASAKFLIRVFRCMARHCLPRRPAGDGDPLNKRE